MLRNVILAFAAVVTLGITATTSTPASAKVRVWEYMQSVRAHRYPQAVGPCNPRRGERCPHVVRQSRGRR